VRILSALLVIGALAACDQPDKTADGIAEEKLGDGARLQEQSGSPGFAAAQVPPPSSSPSPQRSQALPDSIRPTMLIRNGHARIEVDSLEAALAAVQRMAQRLGGYVTSVATQTGREQVREATLTLRIPAARFDAALSGLDPLGDVESVNVTSEDVGEEYVDIGVRLENGRRLERRLLELLQTRAGKLEEVLAVERELARVREEIERHEGRLRYLRSRADVSTLTITLHEPLPLLSNYEGQNVILRAFGQAWRNFVGLVTGVISLLGIILPVAAVLATIWWLARRRRAGSGGK
jgi:hypothetical protein